MKNTCISIMMRSTLLILFIAFPLLQVTSLAQTTGKDFGALALSGPNEILVLIAKDVLHPSTAASTNGWAGYNIYRKAGDEPDFRKMNDTPLSRAGTLDAFNTRSRGSALFLANMLKLRSQEELWDLIVKNDPKVVTLSLFDPNIREAIGLLWRDRDVRKGVTYTYAVARVDAAGRESERTTPSIAVFGVPAHPLKGPLDVKLSGDDRGVTLHWKPNPADKTALGYNVYRSFDKDGRYDRLNDRPIVVFTTEDPKSAPAASFADTVIFPGRKLFYCVVARDFAGNESPRAPVLEITPRDTTSPGIPQRLLARTSGYGLTLTWERVHSDDLVGYHVYRSDRGADGPYKLITDMPVPPDTGIYEDKGVSEEKQYFYEVTAVDRAGNESPPSARGFATDYNFRPPLPPQDVTAEPVSGGIRISWAPDEQSGVQGHVVYRAESMDGALAQISRLIHKDTSEFTDRDARLSPIGAFWYVVQPVASSGLLSPLSVPAIASPVPTEGPEAPLNIRGFSDDSGNRLLWSPSRDNTASGYVVERAQVAAKPKWTVLNKAPLLENQVTLTDTTAARNTAYVYRVKAVNRAGMQGPPSQTVTLQIFTPPPLPPSGIMVTRITGGVRVAWDPSRESSVAGYNVYRRSGEGGPVKLTAKALNSSSSFYEDKKAKKGALYEYTVSCVSNDGRESALSNPVYLTP